MPHAQASRTTAGDAFRSVRRTVFYAGLAALIVGMAASADALLSYSSIPARTICAAPGDSFELSGEAVGLPVERPPRLEVAVTPQEAASSIAISQVSSVKLFFTDATAWTVRMALLPPPSRDVLKVSVTLLDLPHQPAQIWTLRTYPTEGELQSASGSLCLSKLRVDPLTASFCSLAFGSSALLFFFLSPLFFGKRLKEAGYLRVFHAKADGDDTLLYCIDPAGDVRVDRAYTVLSATGQALGLAEITEQGRRHCVFRLRAARARAGCLISLR